jgi:hypothetical protein
MDLPVIVLQTALVVAMAAIGFIMNSIHGEIKSIRERLHKLEGSSASIGTHLNLFNSWISDGSTLSSRITRLETVLENVAPIKRPV